MVRAEGCTEEVYGSGVRKSCAEGGGVSEEVHVKVISFSYNTYFQNRTRRDRRDGKLRQNICIEAREARLARTQGSTGQCVLRAEPSSIL